MRIPIPAMVVPLVVLLLYLFVPGLKERPAAIFLGEVAVQNGGGPGEVTHTTRVPRALSLSRKP
jgi:hypothetical protein